MAKATRDAYGEELAELVASNDKIVVLDADLAGSTKSAMAQKVAPERFFDMGIAEADMIGAAAGLAASGYIPFASSFAMFATGRTWEQIRNSVAYPDLNVKVVGSHSGIAVGEDGVTHQAIEDIAIMRVINNMSIYVPCDQYETKAVVDYVTAHKGPAYLRMGRSAVEDVYPDKDLDVTKIHVLKEGKDTVLFCCGLEVQESLKAAEALQAEGIDAAVVDVCAIKPCDEAGILSLLQKYEHIFTVEEHSVIGGLGSMICELAAEHCPKQIHRIGMTRFGESGSWQVLLHEYQLDGEGIAKKVASVLK
jgi:transketolase